MKVLPQLPGSLPERGHKPEPPAAAEPAAEPRAAAVEEAPRHGPAVEITLSPLAHQLLGGAASPRPLTESEHSRLSGPYGRLGRRAVTGRGG